MAEQPVGSKFLIEIKKKKEVVYSVTLTTDSKETATAWGERWKCINKHEDMDHKVVVTPVHA